MNDTIIIGDRSNPLWTLTADDVRTVRAVLSSALIGDELAVDTLTPAIYTEAYITFHNAFVPAESTGLVTASGKRFRVAKHGTGFKPPVPYGTPVYWMRDGLLRGKFYCKQVLRKTQTDFQMTAVSAVGILDKQTHNGGIYTGQTFAAVATDILGPSFSFQCTSDLAGQRVYGWLPIATRRQNLHQLLFAMGAQIAKDSDGDLFFQYPDTSETDIPEERLYYDGEISYNTNANRVELTEHSYYTLADDEEATLFDNTDGSGTASHLRVVFQDGPVHDLSATTGLTIEESGVNYAVVTGTGVLVGKRYTHTTQLLTATTDGSPLEEQTVAIQDCTLVSVTNSANVLQRLLSYYGSARSISTAIVVDGEKPGQRVSFTNPAMEPEKAFIAEMDLNSSAVLKGNCVLVADYTPTGGGNNFNNYHLMTADGTWTVPADCYLIRIILGSAGQGGWSGSKGEDGSLKNLSYSVDWDEEQTISIHGTSFGLPAKGGQGGDPGQGGKVLVLTLSVQPWQVLNFTKGLAGLGGIYSAAGSVAGEIGGASTVVLNGETYTSEAGVSSVTGYYDLFTGRTFSRPGRAGLPGGDAEGVRADADPAKGEEWMDPVPGTDVVDFNGNVWHAGTHTKDETGLVLTDFRRVSASSGGLYADVSVSLGSGAAAGANGLNGSAQPGTARIGQDYPSGYRGTAIGVAGPNGADATIVPDTATELGCGGDGGYGGGAGGGPGKQELGARGSMSFSRETSTPGPRGVGGRGSNGGKAADGYLLIYY